MAISMSHFGADLQPTKAQQRLQFVKDAALQAGRYGQKLGLRNEQKVINWLTERSNQENTRPTVLNPFKNNPLNYNLGRKTLTALPVIALAQLFTDYPTAAVLGGSTLYGVGKVISNRLTQLGVTRLPKSEARMTKVSGALKNIVESETSETPELSTGQQFTDRMVSALKAKFTKKPVSVS